MTYFFAVLAYLAVYITVRAVGAAFGYDPSLGEANVVVVATVLGVAAFQAVAP